MKSVRWVAAVAVLLGVGSTAAWADTVDPKGKLVGGGGSTGITTINAPDPNFTGTVFGDGGGSTIGFDFINITGVVATEVDLLITNDSPGTLMFSADPENPYFTSSSPSLSSPATVAPGGTVLMRFFGLDPEEGLNGIPFSSDFSCDGISSCFDSSENGSDFIVRFDVTDLSGLGLDPNSATFDFQGTLIGAPEPPTALILVAGAGLLLLLKKL